MYLLELVALFAISISFAFIAPFNRPSAANQTGNTIGGLLAFVSSWGISSISANVVQSQEDKDNAKKFQSKLHDDFKETF